MSPETMRRGSETLPRRAQRQKRVRDRRSLPKRICTQIARHTRAKLLGHTGYGVVELLALGNRTPTSTTKIVDALQNNKV